MRLSFALFFVLAACSAQPTPAPRVELAPAPVAVAPSSTPSALSQPVASLVPATCAAGAPTTDGARPLAAPASAAGTTIMSARFDGGMGFYRVVGAAPSPRAGADSPIEVVVGAAPVLAINTPLLLTVTFTNTSRTPVTLLRPLDGTLEHMRDPGYELYLRDEASGDVYAYAFHGGRCGNVNPITASDYLTLSPGQKRSDVHTNGWGNYLGSAGIGRAGAYSVWVVYRECARGGGVPLGTDVVRSDLHRGVHASNAVRIVIR